MARRQQQQPTSQNPEQPEETNDELAEHLDDGTIVDDEGQPQAATEVAAPAAAAQETVEQRLSKALGVIENLQGEVRSLREAHMQPARPADTQATQQEFETVLGVRLPKDRSQRAVRLSQQDLLAMKWNEDPTLALETLGNVLVNYVLGVVPYAVEQSVSGHLTAQNETGRRRARYDYVYPDLVEFQDLGDLVERRLRDEGYHETYRGDKYLQLVGDTTRARIAQMRGMSVDEYMASLPDAVRGRGFTSGGEPPVSRQLQRQPTSRTTPRTITSPQMSRGATPRADLQQREMDELL